MKYIPLNAHAMDDNVSKLLEKIQKIYTNHLVEMGYEKGSNPCNKLFEDEIDRLESKINEIEGRH